MKPRIMHYYTYPENSGGPLTYIKTICSSELRETYEFDTCYQGVSLSQVDINTMRRIIKEIKKFNPSILQVHGLQGEGFVGALAGTMAGCKCILMTVHGLQQESQNIGRLKKNIFKYIIEPITMLMADMYYCVCEAAQSKSVLISHKNKQYPYIHNCVNQMPNDLSKEDILLIRRRLNFSADDIVGIIVGRVSYDKGMAVLEKIIDNDKDKNIKYLLVGSGDYLHYFQDKYKNNDKVRLVGQQQEVNSFLQASDIYLSVSLHENLSIAALEACATKLPCILSDVGGNAEIITNNKSGFLVPVNDHAKFYEKLKILSKDRKLRSDMGLQAYETVLSEYSLPVFTERINKLYQYLLHRGSY